MSKHDTSSAMIEDQARDWLIRIRAGTPSGKECEAFDAWRSADPRHEAAIRNVETLWTNLGTWDELAKMEPLDAFTLREHIVGLATGVAEHIRRLAPRPAIGFSVAALAVAVIIGLNMMRTAPVNLPMQQVTTQVAEIRDVTLPDSTVVTLGAKSTMEVVYTVDERRVMLASGDAFFSVVKDPDRPFFVIAGETSVRVIGTKFDVHIGPQLVRVSVLEGVVEVTQPTAEGGIQSGSPARSTQVLKAGQQITASRQGILEAVRDIGVSQPGAWRSGRLVYVDASLVEVIADANRYFDGRIELGSPELADLRLTASFRTDQIDQMIKMVATALSMSVDSTVPGVVVLMPETVEK